MLSREFYQTAFVAKLVGHEVYLIVMAASHGNRQSFVQPGHLMAPNAAASAKAIIAFQGAAFISAVLAQPLTKYTANTRADRVELRKSYDQIRRDGYALWVDEMDPGVMTIAVPVHFANAGV